MDQVVRKYKKKNHILDDRVEPAHGSAQVNNPDRKWFKPLPWIARAIFIFALLFSSSYMALILLPPYEGVSITSQLTADYGPWSFLEFQPVDPAIIEEIQQERELPDTLIIDEGFPPTQVILFISTSTAMDVPSPTPQSTIDIPPTSPIAPQPTPMQSSMPTSPTVQSQPTTIPQPSQAAKPTKDRKTPNNEKTPKPTKSPKSQ